MEPAPIAIQVQALLILTSSEQHALVLLGDLAIPHHVFLHAFHVVLCNAIDRDLVFHLAILFAVQMGIPNNSAYPLQL